MTFPWRQLPWLQNKEYPNPGRSSENDSADTQGFGRKMTEGQWITWGSQAVKHPTYTNWLQLLLGWPSARLVSATKIPKLVWPSGHSWVTGAWPNPHALKWHVLLSWATPEPAEPKPAQPSLQHPPKRSNTGSSPILHDPDTAFSTGLPQWMVTAGLWALLWAFT